VVDGVDPRLRAVLGYSRKLAPAVERTIAYFIECGQWLAAPVEFSARRWAGDPLVRTLFATGAELQRFFSDDPGYARISTTIRWRMRSTSDWRDSPRAARLRHGDERRGDAARGAADRDQLLRLPAVRRLRQRAAAAPEYRTAWLRFLIGEALERIVEDQGGTHGREHEKQILDLRLRGLMQKRSALDSLYLESNAGLMTRLPCFAPASCTSARRLPERRQDYAARRLYRRHQRGARRPERYVKRATVRLRINRMNIKVESPDEPGDELTFSEVTIGGRPPRAVVLCRFPRSDLLAARTRLDEAQQSLRL